MISWGFLTSIGFSQDRTILLTLTTTAFRLCTGWYSVPDTTKQMRDELVTGDYLLNDNGYISVLSSGKKDFKSVPRITFLSYKSTSKPFKKQRNVKSLDVLTNPKRDE